MAKYNTTPPQLRNKQNTAGDKARDFAISNQNKSAAAPVSKMGFPTAATTKSSSSPFPTKEPESIKTSFQEKLLGFLGGDKIAKGLGQAIAAGPSTTDGINYKPGTVGTLDEIQKGQGEMQQKLINAIQKNRSIGKDTSRLESTLKMLTDSIAGTGNGAEDALNPNKLTGKEVVGDALQLATTVASVGSLPGAAKNVVTATGAKAGLIEGAKIGAKTGLLFGGATGASQALKNNKNLEDTVADTAKGALTGAVTGGIVSGLIGGVTGALNAKKAKDLLLKARSASTTAAGDVATDLKPSLTTTVKDKIKGDKVFGGMVKEAKKQGFNDAEINFLSTVSDQDKPTLKKMFDLTVKAQSDPRQITRAGDILGDNVTNQVKQVVKLNREAGSLVDKTAKALRGQEVDISPLKEAITTKLDDLGIALADDGTLDFSQSVFKNTPAVQKEIQKVIMSVPDGSDAYQLHIFKKSIDELVDYGTTGEGLKGNSKNLLKGFRSAADDVLDNTFDDYNAANTSFKETRDYIEAAKNLVGKKVDLGSKEGAQAFGQALRSAFSNNKSRGNTLKFIEDTHLIAKQLGLSGQEKNLLDQAIYVNMLEETFGSEAATGLAGEVSKAINKAKTAVDVLRNPVQGGLGVVADVIEKSRNITPEAKKRILEAFIK